MLRIRDVYPGSRVPDPKFFILNIGFSAKKIPGSGSAYASKNLSTGILNQNIYSKLSEIWSRMFIPNPDPGSGFFTHPRSRILDPGPLIRNTAFLFQDPDDVGLLLEELRTKQKWKKINVFQSAAGDKDSFRYFFSFSCIFTVTLVYLLISR